MLGTAGFKAATVSYSHPMARLWDFHVVGGREAYPVSFPIPLSLPLWCTLPTNKSVYTWHDHMLSPEGKDLYGSPQAI